MGKLFSHLMMSYDRRNIYKIHLLKGKKNDLSSLRKLTPHHRVFIPFQLNKAFINILNFLV